MFMIANHNSQWIIDLLLSHCIEPLLGSNVRYRHFPVSKQHWLKFVQEIPPVAERFEVHLEGIEQANGYHELSDPKIQLAVSKKIVKLEKQLGLSRDSY